MAHYTSSNRCVSFNKNRYQVNKISSLIILIVIISACVSKKDNKAEIPKNTISNKIQVTEYKNQDTLAAIVSETEESKLMLIDSFKVESYYFLTVKCTDLCYTMNDTLKRGTYLVNISEDTLRKQLHSSLDKIISKSISSHRIMNEWGESEFFFDVTDLYQLKTITLKHSYPFPVMDSSENAFFFIDEDGRIRKWFVLVDWTDYGTGLTPIKLNDSILSSSYSSRDRLGFFHSDYKIYINTKTRDIKYFHPKEQAFKYSGLATDSFILYSSKEEAKSQIILSDTMTISEGTEFKFDSVYWELDVFKIIIPNVDTGFVNMNQQGFKTPENNAC